MQITAEVKLDSVDPHGVRLTTMEVTYPRFIHSEFMTHRVFSRNSASSRAIPIQKQIDKIIESCAQPLEFGTNQPGMQAGPPLQGVKRGAAYFEWIQAAGDAVERARKLMELGVHKQVVNRILEPFMMHTVIVTSTYYQGFFDQRCSPLAQPEIEALAIEMREAYNKSEPQLVTLDKWHTPYIQEDELDLPLSVRIRVSAARCARVSYLTQNGVRDYQEDLNLFKRLTEADPPHYSPLEHVATPFDYGLNPWGNFIYFDEQMSYQPVGWAQLRHNMEALNAMV